MVLTANEAYTKTIQNKQAINEASVPEDAMDIIYKAIDAATSSNQFFIHFPLKSNVKLKEAIVAGQKLSVEEWAATKDIWFQKVMNELQAQGYMVIELKNGPYIEINWKIIAPLDGEAKG